MLTLATWNVLHGIRVRPDEAAGGAAPVGPGAVDPAGLSSGAMSIGADVLGMQEVDRGQPRSSGADQTRDVAAAIGAVDWRFVPALHGTPGEVWRAATVGPGALRTGPGDGEDDGPAYGVALVSRLPVRSWHALRFPAARGSLPLLVPGQGLVRVPDEPRVVLAAVVELESGATLTLATCHLSFVPGANVRQLRRTCAWLRELPAPRVLLGDLNLPGRLPGLVSRWSQLVRRPTYPSWGPRVQWDHALSEDPARLVLSSADVLRLPVSDHCALRVRLAGL